MKSASRLLSLLLPAALFAGSACGSDSGAAPPAAAGMRSEGSAGQTTDATGGIADSEGGAAPNSTDGCQVVGGERTIAHGGGGLGGGSGQAGEVHDTVVVLGVPLQPAALGQVPEEGTPTCDASLKPRLLAGTASRAGQLAQLSVGCDLGDLAIVLRLNGATLTAAKADFDRVAFVIPTALSGQHEFALTVGLVTKTTSLDIEAAPEVTDPKAYLDALLEPLPEAAAPPDLADISASLLVQMRATLTKLDSDQLAQLAVIIAGLDTDAASQQKQLNDQSSPEERLAFYEADATKLRDDIIGSLASLTGTCSLAALTLEAPILGQLTGVACLYVSWKFVTTWVPLVKTKVSTMRSQTIQALAIEPLRDLATVASGTSMHWTVQTTYVSLPGAALGVGHERVQNLQSSVSSVLGSVKRVYDLLLQNLTGWEAPPAYSEVIESNPSYLSVSLSNPTADSSFTWTADGTGLELTLGNGAQVPQTAHLLFKYSFPGVQELTRSVAVVVSGDCKLQCEGGKALDEATCTCECNPGLELCGSHCYNKNCAAGFIFHEQGCFCGCPTGLTLFCGTCVATVPVGSLCCGSNICAAGKACLADAQKNQYCEP